MTRRFRNLLCVVSALGVLAAAGQTIAARSSEGAADKPACEVLREWARAYESTQPTLDELATFDRGRRIAIFNAVTPDVRAALWQEQMTRFSQRGDLSTTQRELIAEARTMLTPSIYGGDKAARQSFERFQPRVEAAFTSAEHKRAWLDLGSVSPAAEGATGLASDRSDSPLAGKLYGGGPCHCYTLQPSWQCPTGVPCNGTPCTGTAWGCGMGGNRPCDGTCGSR